MSWDANMMAARKERNLYIVKIITDNPWVEIVMEDIPINGNKVQYLKKAILIDRHEQIMLNLVFGRPS